VTTKSAPLAGTDLATRDTSTKRIARRFMPLLVLVVLGCAYAGYHAWQASRPYEWSGTVEARTVSVGSRAGGRVKQVLAHEGDQVAAGQPLVILETGDLDAQRLVAQGQLDQAEANLDKLKKGARPEEIEQAKARAQTATAALAESKAGARSEQIAAANARLIAAQVAADKARIDLDRAHKLLAASAISQAEVDTAEAQLRGAFAQRDALNQALEELKNGVRREEIQQASARADEARASARLVEAGSRVEDIRAAQGQVEAARGKLDTIKVMIDELTIRAPGPSRVEALDLRPGDILAPNATAATLLEDGQLYVRIYVPETRIGRLHLGDEVPVSVDSFPSRSFKGRVEHISMVGEYSPRNLQTADERADQVFATRIGLLEGATELRAGMAAFIRVAQ
jgi:HlyD family secretion protein